MHAVNPFQTDLCKTLWFEKLAPAFQLGQRFDDLVIFKKPVFRGIASLNKLKPFASNLAWFLDFDEKQAETLLELKGKADWDHFSITWHQDREALQAFHRLEAAGLKVQHQAMTPMYAVDLQQGYEGYLAAKGSKFRYNVRQKLKAAEKLGLELRSYTGAIEIEPFFETFFTHHIPYWEQKIGSSYYSNPHERAFSLAWSKALHQEGKLRLHGLHIGGELTNLSVSIIEGNTLYWLLTINTGVHHDLFPGLVSLYLRLQEAGDAGIRNFNMGFGDYNYKHMVATHLEKRVKCTVINPVSLKGRLYALKMASHTNETEQMGK